MARAPDVDDRIVAAIKRLQRAKRRVTVRAVREEAGGGSLRDINPVVRKWREAKRKATQEAVVNRMVEERVYGERAWLERLSAKQRAKEREERTLAEALEDFTRTAGPLVDALGKLLEAALRRVGPFDKLKREERDFVAAMYYFRQVVERLAAFCTRVPQFEGDIPDQKPMKKWRRNRARTVPKPRRLLE